MSRQSFEAEFRAFEQRVRQKGLQDWDAFVAQQKTAGQVAAAAVYEMARRHDVKVNASATVYVESKRPNAITVVYSRVTE